MKFGQLILGKFCKFVASRCQILSLKCTKFNVGWRSAPDPAGELTALPGRATFKEPTSKWVEGLDVRHPEKYANCRTGIIGGGGNTDVCPGRQIPSRSHWPSAVLIKYPQTFNPCYPLFTGAKCPKFWPKILMQIVFGPPYFWTVALYRRTKTNLAKTDDRPTTAPNLGWVGPTYSENRWRNRYPKRVKVQNFLYILRSSGPRRVQRHQCYTTC